jgi:acyl-coenzyme A synthetase/AMP-(fatty) acid ligase
LPWLKRIVIVDRLPRNSQGKITKKDLLPLFERK